MKNIRLIFLLLLGALQAAAADYPQAKDFPAHHPLRQLLAGQSQCAHPDQTLDIAIVMTPQIRAEMELLMHYVGTSFNVTDSDYKALLKLKVLKREKLELYEFSGTNQVALMAEDQKKEIQDLDRDIANLDKQIRKLESRIQSSGRAAGLYNIETYRGMSTMAYNENVLPLLENLINQVLEPIQQEIRGRGLRTAEREKIIKNLVCDLSPAEILSITYYTAQGYAPINRGLRLGQALGEPMNSTRIVMDAALAKLKPYMGSARRGSTFLSPEQWARQEISDPAYLSTSILYRKTFPGHQFTIRTRTGRWIAPYSVNFNEDEVLFPRGARFKVRGHESLKNPANDWFAIEMDEI